MSRGERGRKEKLCHAYVLVAEVSELSMSGILAVAVHEGALIQIVTMQCPVEACLI